MKDILIKEGGKRRCLVEEREKDIRLKPIKEKRDSEETDIRRNNRA